MTNENSNFPTDLKGIMDLAQKLQGDVAKMQEQLQEMVVEGAAGGGMVKASVNGNYDLVSLSIEDEVIDANEKEMLQDLILAAVNQAIEKMRVHAKSEMNKTAGGINIPGMPGNFSL